jgi:NAD(P)-dependent dehydrogenase (short-subunit alcohol dehydrogenase family)
MATQEWVNTKVEESITFVREQQSAGGTPTGRLKGKIALITGGTPGIGFATAHLFQNGGAQVIITGRNPKTVEHAQKALGPGPWWASDASNLADTDSLIKIVSEKFGRLDILFANAASPNSPLSRKSTRAFLTVTSMSTSRVCPSW